MLCLMERYYFILVSLYALILFESTEFIRKDMKIK